MINEKELDIVEWNKYLDNSKKIVIYGAGHFSNVLVEYLENEYFNYPKLNAIVVTGQIEPYKMRGISVFNAEYLESIREKEGLLVIVATDEEKHGEISETLLKYKLKNTIYMTRNLYRFFAKEIDSKKMAKRVEYYAQEMVAGLNLDRLMRESNWLKRTDLTAEIPSVNNKYLYFIYKMLNTGKFKSILDLGMGQTSKMISQYVNYDDEAKHVIVESDNEWIEFFKSELAMSNRCEIMQLDYVFSDFKGENVRKYDEFKQNMMNKKFDLISIDAPWGADMKNYSRVDILDIVPDCLESSWVIMIDNVERTGEMNTYKLIMEKLQQNGIKAVSTQHGGIIDSFMIITSYDNRFFLNA